MSDSAVKPAVAFWAGARFFIRICLHISRSLYVRNACAHDGGRRPHGTLLVLNIPVHLGRRKLGGMKRTEDPLSAPPTPADEQQTSPPHGIKHWKDGPPDNTQAILRNGTSTLGRSAASRARGGLPPARSAPPPCLYRAQASSGSHRIIRVDPPEHQKNYLRTPGAPSEPGPGAGEGGGLGTFSGPAPTCCT